MAKFRVYISEGTEGLHDIDSLDDLPALVAEKLLPLEPLDKEAAIQIRVIRLVTQ